MTVEEVCEYVQRGEDKDAVVAWRFAGRSVAGSRIDLRCSICGYRVSLNPVSVQRVENGAFIFCRNECWPRIKARCAPEDIREIPDTTEYKR